MTTGSATIQLRLIHQTATEIAVGGISIRAIGFHSTTDSSLLVTKIAAQNPRNAPRRNDADAPMPEYSGARIKYITTLGTLVHRPTKSTNLYLFLA